MAAATEAVDTTPDMHRRWLAALMYAQAVRYYFRAFRLSREDEHLLYNIARTYYERGKLRLATKFLDMALARDANFREGLALGRAIEQKEAEQRASGTDAWELRFKA